jgi:hypothetical protein
MNKKLAMEWLIENVTRWPTSKGGIVSAPNGWVWSTSSCGDIELAKTKKTLMVVDCYITQLEWDSADLNSK